MIAAILGLGSSIVNGLFGMKKKQGEVIESALKSLESVQATDSAYFAASSSAIEAVYKHGGWFERGWRPALMWTCVGVHIARVFGYELHMSPEDLDHFYQFTYIGLGGYIPLRSLEKITQGFQVGAILKRFIEKKIL